MRRSRSPEQRRADEERLQRAIEKSKAELAEWRRQLEREATGEARGFRYAIECDSFWIDADGKHKSEPTIFDGDHDSSQARASMHHDKNRLDGGAIYHGPTIYPESMVANRVALHEYWEKRWSNHVPHLRMAEKAPASILPAVAPIPAARPKKGVGALLDGLHSLGWCVVGGLRVPHATSPDGEIRLWFKPRAVHVSCSPHSLGAARSLVGSVRGLAVDDLVGLATARRR